MKPIVFLTLAIVLNLTSANLTAQSFIDPALGFTLENDYVRYVFEPVGMGLSAMTDKRTGYNHIDNVQGKHLLWQITIINPAPMQITLKIKKATRFLSWSGMIFVSGKKTV